ncbi:hypothetical protein ABT263_14690 [Kitasatospora sp. NPDC001603]|uniref:hypothetical protein n=1 Tax=Kitasatospora sp. NPDC001603 TaxID=3154388 RepID=UPI003334A154
MSDTQVLFGHPGTTAGTAVGRPLAVVERDAVPPRRRGPAPVPDVLAGADEEGDEPSGAAGRQWRGRAAHCRIALQYLD